LGNRSKVVDKKEACHHQQSFLSLLHITDPAITRNLRPAKKKKKFKGDNIQVKLPEKNNYCICEHLANGQYLDMF